jgi:hypothetical protein
MATTRETIESRAAAYAPLLRALGVGDEKARDEDTHAILAVLGAEYRQQLATWEAGPRLKDAVVMLRRIETLSGELARALDTCPSAVMNLLRSPFFLSDVDDKMPSDDLLAMFRNAHYNGLPEGPGQGGDWVTRLAALSRFCGRAVARMQEEVGATSGDAIARGGRQRAAALRQPHPGWEFTKQMLTTAEGLLGRGLGAVHGDGARFGAFLDAVAGLALAREVALADAYGHEFLRATLRIRAINRRLDALDAADVTEIGRLLTERGRLKRRLQEGPRKKARPQAQEHEPD